MGDYKYHNCSPSHLLFLLPLITCLLFPVTFAVSYAYAAYNRDLNTTSNCSCAQTDDHPYWEGPFPYISETGTKPPESCIFGQLLNIAAVVCGLTLYIRYRQTQQALDHFLPSDHHHRTNTASLVIGMMAAFGVSMVGNFQMDNLLIAHYIGAMLAFVLGAVYAWLQVFISYKLLMFMCTRPMFYLRFVASSFVTIFLLGTMVGGLLYGATTDMNFRLLSTVSEWVMALALAVVFASFASEFRATKIEKPRISIVQLSK